MADNNTKGIQKVRSFYYKMTSQAKNFVVMIKLTITEASTQNFMFTTFLVSSLAFFKHGYPTQNMKTDNSEWRIVIWFSVLVCATWMELYELMVNTYTGKGPTQAAIKPSAPQYKREKI